MEEIYVKLRPNEKFITLQALLQINKIISTGGMAKIFLSENDAIVNGEKENRRGRKLYPNDKICLLNCVYIVKNNDS